MTTDRSFQDPDNNAGGQAPQSFDAALRAALHDVPVPDDLAERIVARLETDASSNCSAGKTPVPPSRRVRVSRRRALVVGVSISLVAIAALSVVYWQRTPRLVSREALSSNVAGWVSSLPDKNWRPI